MNHETVSIFCCFVAVLIVFVIDFDAANDRWCKTYPEWCEPVEIAEVVNYEGWKHGYDN